MMIPGDTLRITHGAPVRRPGVNERATKSRRLPSAAVLRREGFESRRSFRRPRWVDQVDEQAKRVWVPQVNSPKGSRQPITCSRVLLRVAPARQPRLLETRNITRQHAVDEAALKMRSPQPSTDVLHRHFVDRVKLTGRPDRFEPSQALADEEGIRSNCLGVGFEARVCLVLHVTSAKGTRVSAHALIQRSGRAVVRALQRNTEASYVFLNRNLRPEPRDEPIEHQHSAPPTRLESDLSLSWSG
jgi:hypothetical protein